MEPQLWASGLLCALKCGIGRRLPSGAACLVVRLRWVRVAGVGAVAVCLRCAAIRVRRVQASSSVDCRRAPPRAAIASQPPRLRAARLCSISVMSPRTLPSLPGSRRRRRARTPRALNQVRTKPPDRWDNADRNPAPARSQNRVTHASRLVARIAPLVAFGLGLVAFGLGLRILATGPPLPTVLLLRRLWAPIPKFVTTAMNQGA